MADSVMEDIRPTREQKDSMGVLEEVSKEAVTKLDMVSSSPIFNAGDELRKTYLKFSKLKREGKITPENQTKIDKALEEYHSQLKESMGNELTYMRIINNLNRNLAKVEDGQGNKIVDQIMDGKMYDAVCALSEGVYAGLKKIYDNIMQAFDTIKALIEPETWQKIYETMTMMIKNPKLFLEKILDYLKEEAYMIYNDVKLVLENFTKTGASVELGKILPETAVPFIIGKLTGPAQIAEFAGKFFKIGKGVKAVGTVEKVSEKSGKAVEKGVVKAEETALKAEKTAGKMEEGAGKIAKGAEMEDRLWKFENPNVADVHGYRHGLESMQRMEKILYRKEELVEILKDPDRMANFVDSMYNMTDYIGRNMANISKLPKEMRQDFFRTLRDIRNSVNEFYIKDKQLGNKLNEIFESNEFKSIYGKLLELQR